MPYSEFLKFNDIMPYSVVLKTTIFENYINGNQNNSSFSSKLFQSAKVFNNLKVLLKPKANHVYVIFCYRLLTSCLQNCLLIQCTFGHAQYTFSNKHSKIATSCNR